MRLQDLAAAIGGVLKGNPDLDIAGVSSLEHAGERDIAFVASRKNVEAALASKAGALIAPQDLDLPGRQVVEMKNPKLGFARALGAIYPEIRPEPGVHPSAVVSPSASLGRDLSIGPHAVVEDGASVGDRTVLLAGSYVGRGTRVGEDCLLHPQARILQGCRAGDRVILHAGVVIGSDGFGYATEGGVHHKVPHRGIVVIEDDVEIGANTTIDRGTLGETVIGRGTKIDNLVHIAHNVKVGPGCLMAAQVGIAGSTTIGSYVLLGGQTAIADHLNIGSGVMVVAQSGIAQDVPAKSVISGSPAFPHRDWLRASVLYPRLPEMEKRIRRLEALMAKSEEADGQAGGSAD